jgi:hypothetical protein
MAISSENCMKHAKKQLPILQLWGIL